MLAARNNELPFLVAEIFTCCSLFQSLLLFFVITLMIFAQRYTCQNVDIFDECGKFFECGGLKNVGYPFWGKDRPEYCGPPGFQLNCTGDVARIAIRSMQYRVLKVDNDTFKVAREDLWNSSCITVWPSTRVDFSLFNYVKNYQNISIFYLCSSLGQIPKPNQFICSNIFGTNFFRSNGSGLGNRVKCDINVTVPVSADAALRLESPSANETVLRSALTSGFGLQWYANNSICNRCVESAGRCGYNNSINSFVCHCSNGQYPLTCNKTQERGTTIRSAGRRNRLIILTVIGIAIFLAVVMTALLTFTIYNRRAQHRQNINAEAFMKQFGAAGPKHYSYSQIKKMTNSFADKLGEGGYGSVYKGKLPDGSLVAVKVLSGIQGNGEDFINEVASISRTSHVNIVTLLGFCLHKDQRALILQFMPNGSLDKFVSRKTSDSAIGMDCKTQFKIAVGSARGLEYLHRGCNTRIVHFDIKPHNILLDEDFCPKISDFGLAKLSGSKKSMFSKLSARGTIGYIAPELIFRKFGSVSAKSDVYSYGMMILEMVGARTKPNTDVDRSSQLYFPNWIYEQLELGKDLEIRVLEDSEDQEIERKLILVGLWCIQTKPSDRPSMSKVVEMLEGSLESLQFPPKPLLLLYSPERSPQESPEMSPEQPSTSEDYMVPSSDVLAKSNCDITSEIMKEE